MDLTFQQKIKELKLEAKKIKFKNFPLKYKTILISLFFFITFANLSFFEYSYHVANNISAYRSENAIFLLLLLIHFFGFFLFCVFFRIKFKMKEELLILPEEIINHYLSSFTNEQQYIINQRISYYSKNTNQISLYSFLILMNELNSKKINKLLNKSLK